jgi:hypothetical protein
MDEHTIDYLETAIYLSHVKEDARAACAAAVSQAPTQVTKAPTETVFSTKGCLSTSLLPERGRPGVAFPSSVDARTIPIRKEKLPRLFHVEHQ